MQNADDAKYLQHNVTPAITFTVCQTELIVDLNEDGFSLSDVRSICYTGQSSKTLDTESTGEKGFGFKSVFAVADQVRIQSGLWSFRFEHKREDDGLGMITPIWEQTENHLPSNVRTRFILRYAASEDHGLEDLCAEFEAQHPSILFALRKLKKMCINFQDVEGRNHTICFDKTKYATAAGAILKISSQIANNVNDHIYRTFEKTVTDMPKHPERSSPISKLKIGLPVTRPTDGIPELSGNGEYTFAYLPIVRMTQLRFLIHADFLLPANRQAIVDNQWNKRLRDEVVSLFVLAVRIMAGEGSRLSYQWPAYLPLQHIAGFWHPFQRLITQQLLAQQVLYSRSTTLQQPGALRILPNHFKHSDEPLLSDSARPWRFLSPKYSASHFPALRTLGVKDFSYQEAFDVIDDDISSNDSKLRTTPLRDIWHASFCRFIQHTLTADGSIYTSKIYERSFVPVRVQGKLEWRRPGRTIYFPTIVDEGTGSDRIHLEMPANLDLIVLHPDAAANSSRLEVYQLLGVQHCPSTVVCNAVVREQSTGGTKTNNDLLTSLQLLFWFSHKFPVGVSKYLVAKTADAKGLYLNTNGLFLRSDQRYHAESLLRLASNPLYNKNFLDPTYQTSAVSTRTRGGSTWEQWLCDVAGMRWYPPLQDSADGSQLHWALEKIRTDNSLWFVPLIQHYWTKEYGSKCRFNQHIKQVLMECKVLCQHGGFEELQQTWFPQRDVLDTASEYGVEKKLPILALPDFNEEPLASQWSAVSELGVRSGLDLSFFQQALELLSSSGDAPAIGTEKMGWLYKNLGDKVTLEDRNTLKVSVSSSSYHF